MGLILLILFEKLLEFPPRHNWVFWERWDAGLIPSLAQWVKDLALLQL